MLRNCKYILWDWNGTLLDDVTLNFDVVNHMLCDRGISPMSSQKLYTEYFGFPVIDFYRNVGFDFTYETFEHAAQDYVMWYERLFNEARLFGDTVKTLTAVRNSGIKQIILSATKKSNLIKQVEPFGISGFFEEILGVSDSLGSGKVDIAGQWLSQSGLTAENIVMIGDTVHDFEVSQALNCKCVLVSSGHQNMQRLKATGAVVVSGIGDVIDFVGETL